MKVAGGCDAHTHIFGPYDRYPLVGASAYVPPLAAFEMHAAMLRDLGLDRAVLIQPAPYRLDHSALLAALECAEGRLRGTGVVDENTSDATLDRMRAAGVTGFRFVEAHNPNGEGRYPGTIGFDAARNMSERLLERGFHLQLWAGLADCVAIAREAAAMGMPLVLDHLAGIGPDDDPDDPLFADLLAAIGTGHVWVKLTYHRQSRQPRRYEDMRRAVTALSEAGPSRLIWGSDWPFVRMEGREPDPVALTSQLHDWVGAARFRRIMADNPAELFGY